MPCARCSRPPVLREIRRRPWLSSIGPAGLPVLSPISEHGLRWQSYEEIAGELGRLLCEEAIRVCQGRREIYVLLSGGLDSRIVAATLSKLVDDGRLPTKPIALTWGLLDSRDYLYGRETARILGLEWVHASLGPEHLRQNLADTAELLAALVSDALNSAASDFSSLVRWCRRIPSVCCGAGSWRPRWTACAPGSAPSTHARPGNRPTSCASTTCTVTTRVL